MPGHVSFAVSASVFCTPSLPVDDGKLQLLFSFRPRRESWGLFSGCHGLVPVPPFFLGRSPSLPVARKRAERAALSPFSLRCFSFPDV